MGRKGSVDLIEAQRVYNGMQKSPGRVIVKTSRCPKKCKGRIKNKGQCTPENCIMLAKRPVALSAVKIASGAKKPGIRKLDRRDMRVLGTLSREFKYRNKGRPEIKRQLKEAKGLALPRLNPRANHRVVRITWETIFKEYRRVTGKRLKKQIRGCWKKLGKSYALRTVHAAAKRLGKKTTLPFYTTRG